MYKKHALYLITALLLTLSGFAQSKADYQQQYLKAKSLFKQERWQEAMEAFRPLTSANRQNAFAEYASFYYGLAALQQNRVTDARAMFRQIQQRYPGWNKQDEVSFWLAKSYFLDNAFRQALAEIQDMRKGQVRQDAEKLARTELSRIPDISLLDQLLQDFNEPYVAQVLAQKIYQQPLAQQDREKLQSLVDKYKLDEELLQRPEIADSKKKAVYDVAVMLPFLLNEVKAEPGMHERYFILDLYEGMELAQERLEEQGIQIRLNTFDTRRDSLVTRKILNQPELKKMDLIVGPLFPGPSKVATRFAYENNINIVNPLSVNSDYIQNNPYSFLFKPSLETQGRKAAAFAVRNFTDSTKRATVVYSYKQRDSIMAHSYQQVLAENGFKVRMVKVKEGLENAVKNVLAPNPDWDESLEDPKFQADSLGHIFVATDNKLIVANVISAILSRGDNLPLIGHLDWLRDDDMARFISYSQMERLGAYFVAPEFIDYSTENFLKFRETYKEKVNYLPTEYAYVGYELMMYFGKMMERYGNHFQAVADRQPVVPGELCTGFSYLNSNDNQCVPIIQFRDAALVVVYQ